MPEPNTSSHIAPESESRHDEANTVGWAPPEQPGTPAHETTHTRDLGSTPGAAHSELHTRTEDTERLPDASFTLTELPNIPGYRIEKLIGRGGMANVYRAVHLEMNRVVALKLINPGGRDELYVRERFEREVQTLASVEHPNIVPVYHSGTWHGFPFLTMKFIPAGSLNLHMARFKGNPETAARLASKIARGVQALHEAGILHRDLKPLNILLGAEDEPLVADFGLAKWVDESNSDLTVTHIPLGTRQYMSPEQTLGQKTRYAPPSDIWAIGIILHELLSGRRPFCDVDTTDLYESIRTAAPPPLPAEVPESICSVVQKCLAKNPQDRYQSAAAVADHLEDWLAGRPVVVPAPPPPPPGRSTPPWLVTVCICVLVALIFLPPVLIPFGQAREATLVADETAPLSLIQLLNRDGKVQLTNETGKPLFPLRKIPGHDLAIAIQDGHHRFWGRNAYGMMEFSGDKLPLPIVLEGDVGVSLGSAEPLTSITTAGIYVGRRNWPSASPEIQSCILFTIEENSSEMPQKPRYLRCMARAYVWEGEGLGAPRALGEARLPWDPGGKNFESGLRTCRIVVEIHEDRLIATFDGQPLQTLFIDKKDPPHILPVNIGRQLKDAATDRSRLRGINFEPPVLGDGIGITVGHGEGLIRNLRLTRIVP